MCHAYLLIASYLAAPSPTEHTWSHPRKFVDANCTNSCVLNSGVTEPNLTKFLQDVHKWLPITLLKSTLRSPNRKIAAESGQKLRILTA